MTISAKSEKDNHGLVNLAVQCMFINSKEQEKIFATLKGRVKEDPGYSVIELFKEEDTLSEEKIDFLLAFKEYLDTKALDTEFGELAIANDFTTREAINAALDYQNDCYSKTEQTKEISEVLLKKDQISLKNCTAVLLAQDRIKDEFLARALDNLGSTVAEKKAINKRFGVIALKREFISLEQLNQALIAQESELLLGQLKRHISEILEESAELSVDNTMIVLKKQKQFEKRRLDIEKALGTYNSEIRSSNKLSEFFKYRVSKDGLEAHVSKIKDLLEEIKPYDFYYWLKQIGLKFGIVDDETIEDFLLNQKIEEEIVIAKGYPPVEGKDESIEYFFDTKFCMPENASDFKEKDAPFVKKGDILAKISPVKKGKPGKDVWGQLIEPGSLKICPIESWKGVRLDDLIFIADMDGVALLSNEKSIIVSQPPEESQTHVIKKDIETEALETYKSVNLEIKGMIGEKAVVTCHDLIIDGDALGNINATGDIEIKGSIGKIKGTEDEKINQPNIFADGDIIVKKDIANARLETSKELIAPNAEITSSKIAAVNGIIIKSVLLNETNPSVLQIGKKSNPKIIKIDKIIEAKAAALKKLKYQEDLEKLENEYQKQVAEENGFIERNDVLKDLLGRINDSDYEAIQELEQNQYPDTPVNANKNKYMLVIVKEVLKIEAKDQKSHIEKILDKESGMHKAAMEVTKQMCDDQKVKYEEINKKIFENIIEIENLELEIETLSLGRESIFSKEEQEFLPVNAVIKIKDQIAKGTVIKGQKSQMVIDKTMYGVKLMEIKDSQTGATEISVEGYFS